MNDAGLSVMQALLWALAVGAPTATLVLLAATASRDRRAHVRARRVLIRIAPATTAPAGLLALVGPAAGVLDAPWLVLGTRLEVDELGRPLLLLAAVLYGTALTAVAFSTTPRAHLLSAFLLLSFLGNSGVFLAADTVSFYVSFAVMSLAAYGCVVHTRSESARRAGRVYLVLTMLSEMAVLSALVLVVAAGGALVTDAPAAVANSELRNVIVALLLVGFGIKAGSVPLHVWLPLAHPAAPPAASAVLSGAMVKAGLIGWLRFLPLGEVALPGWGLTLTVLALSGAFLALPLGVLHSDPKVPLAYSTISQMGFLAMLVGIALGQPDLAPACVLAAVVYAVHHGVAKGGLFLGVAIWQRHYAGRWRLVVLAVLALLAIAVAGAPLGSGAVAKYAAKQAVAPVALGPVQLADLLPWVGTVSTLLLARAGWVLIHGKQGPTHHPDPALYSWVVLALLGSGATWLLAERWAPLVSVPGLDAVTVWDASWPVLVGVLLAAAVWALSHAELLPRRLGHPDGTLLPAGDLVVVEEAALTRVVAAARRAGSWSAAGLTARVAERLTPRRLPVAGDRFEMALSGWITSGLAIITVAAMLGLALLLGWRS